MPNAIKTGPIISGDEALRIAETDARTTYRDLAGFKIVLSLEVDGWHVDYELKDPKALGGGPHYVIDGANRTILSKRYEQ